MTVMLTLMAVAVCLVFNILSVVPHSLSVNPVRETEYMALSCFLNGAITRDVFLTELGTQLLREKRIN